MARGRNDVIFCAEKRETDANKQCLMECMERCSAVDRFSIDDVNAEAVFLQCTTKNPKGVLLLVSDQSV